MRNRSLTLPGYISPYYEDSTVRVYTNPDYQFLNSKDVGIVDLGDVGTYPLKVSNINDEVGDPAEVYVDPVTGKWRRIRRKMRDISVIGDAPLIKQSALRAEDLKPVHKCEHLKTHIALVKEIVVAHEATRFPGNPIFERVDTRTAKFANGAQLLLTEGASSIEDYFINPQGDWSAGGYLTHDWFAITDSFNEACDQFINSKFLIGEDIAEHDIFVDAFKLVLNPTRAVRFLLNGIRLDSRLKKRYRKMNLGQATRELAKGAANATLFYNFALKPAIHDIQDLFLAHRRVSQRMQNLKDGAGRYIPVRVKDELHSSVSNSLLETVLNTDFKWHCDYKKSTATMGTWARVREDLTFASTWSAYLQYFGINKMAGLVWELIPCSFMIDWVFGAQEYVNKLRFRTDSPFNEFRGMWHSVKQETSEKLYCIPGYSPAFDDYMTTPSGSFVVAQRRTTNYLRYPGFPKTTESSLDFSELGLFHLLTSGSIIIQKWLK